jgi:hypothetical protein
VEKLQQLTQQEPNETHCIQEIDEYIFCFPYAGRSIVNCAVDGRMPNRSKNCIGERPHPIFC